MEIKIQCDCGQRFKFDVEPINGRMPFVVNCPTCGVDGTVKANEVLRQVPGLAEGVEYPPAELAASASGPARVHLNQPAPGPPATGPAGSMAAPRASPTRFGGRPQQITGPTPALPTQKPSFALGFLGAVVGTLVGSLIYFLIFNYTGLRIKLLAIGVGYLAGLGAELLGRKEGSKELGMIAAVLALSGIVSAQYFVARTWWNTAAGSTPKTSDYATSVTEAKRVITAIPTGSDSEVRIYLAKETADAGEKPDPQSVTDEEIKEFRETTLSPMWDLASGKTTKEVFDKKQQNEATQDRADPASEEGTFKAVFLLLLLSKLNLVSLAGAAGLAFKVCSNA